MGAGCAMDMFRCFNERIKEGETAKKLSVDNLDKTNHVSITSLLILSPAD